MFLTTRVLDFLKSLPIPREGGTVEALLAGEYSAGLAPRQRLGLALLRELLATGVLHAATPQGWKPLKRFRAELFFRIWNDLDFIGTQDCAKLYKTTITSGCALKAM